MQVYIQNASAEDKEGLELASLVASRSKCVSRKVGCVIRSSRTGAFGYNQPPSPIRTCDRDGCRDEPDGRCSNCRHAEIIAMERWRSEEKNCFPFEFSLYATCPPCVTCALEIVAAHIPRVVCYTHPKRDERAIERLLEAGVEYIEVMP